MVGALFGERSAVHVGLYSVLGKLKVSTESAPLKDLILERKNFKLDRVTVIENRSVRIAPN